MIMAKSLGKDQSIGQKNNASCISNKRGMARRAKRNSNKRDRQLLKKELTCILIKTDLLLFYDCD
jgi:hypothetical protein